MTLLDIHPEHLIDRVRHGVANDAEQRELTAHLQRCRACALEWQLAQTLAEDPREPWVPNGPMIDASLAVLMSEGRLRATPEASASTPARGRFVPWAAALCLFFTGSAAAATLIMAVRQGSAPALPVIGSDSNVARPSDAPHALRAGEAPLATTPAAAAAPAAPTATPTATATPTPMPAAATSSPNPFAPPLARATPRDASPRHAHEPHELHAAASQVASPSADELFQKARAAMLRGEQQTAVALCLTLQERFTASSQAQVSRVLLGRLFLEQLHQPSAALLQFDAYLERAGENRPEALLGRANALRALGRTQEEIEALRLLVDGYPGSLYVAPAEKRLRALR